MRITLAVRGERSWVWYCVGCVGVSLALVVVVEKGWGLYSRANKVTMVPRLGARVGGHWDLRWLH